MLEQWHESRTNSGGTAYVQETCKPTIEESTHKPSFFDTADLFLERHSASIVLALCLIAAMRLHLFITTFPFFNNVDEQAHYDTAYKYSQGYMPQGLEFFSPGSCKLILFYGTPEYFYKRESLLALLAVSTSCFHSSAFRTG